MKGGSTSVENTPGRTSCSLFPAEDWKQEQETIFYSELPKTYLLVVMGLSVTVFA